MSQRAEREENIQHLGVTLLQESCPVGENALFCCQATHMNIQRASYSYVLL